MRAAVVPDRVMILDKRQSTTAGSDLDSDLLASFEIEFVSGNARVEERLARRRECQRHCPRNMLAIFSAKLSSPIKVAHLRGDLHGRVGDIERFNTPHAALTILQASPERVAADAYRRDASHTGDDHPPRRLEVA